MGNLVIESAKLYSLYLKERALSDLELLNGGFFPYKVIYHKRLYLFSRVMAFNGALGQCLLSFQ